MGTLRDIVQNHLLQVVALLAMEPPVAADPDALRDETTKVLRAMRPLDLADVVRGQYRGYRNEEGVAEDSRMETFVALRAWVDSWRWAGVPFYLRAGKHLATNATEVQVEFQRHPRLLFAGDDAPPPHPNHLVFSLQPGEKVSLGVQVKRPGEGLATRPAALVYAYDEARDGRRDSAYTHLIADALVDRDGGWHCPVVAS
ncbi:MAG: hypothetical protein M3O86_02475 [Actinomycetota bacterium]|nr:hypothetical protein [Actinomycetota bacterium]